MLRLKYGVHYESSELVELLSMAENNEESVGVETLALVIIVIILSMVAMLLQNSEGVMGLLLVVSVAFIMGALLINFYMETETRVDIPFPQVEEIVEKLEGSDYKGVIFLKGTETDAIGTDYMSITPQEIQE